MKIRTTIRLLFATSLLTVSPAFAQVAEKPAPTSTLITGAKIFDGSDKLVADMSLLVEGNKITRIAKSIEAPAGATVIDAKGRTMTPGLIDCHVHLAWVISSPYAMFDTPADYQAALALVEAKAMLMRGYTSIRDTAGQVFGTKRAIDEGLFPGPRIWGCGAAISMTSGHGDFRTLNTEPRPKTDRRSGPSTSV
ncbi:MAG: amidohydrolase family protein [Verrucomicrobia bacterium]|nr:amidohydrolase family protein [Verrucomicrobiota bacterium]